MEKIQLYLIELSNGSTIKIDKPEYDYLMRVLREHEEENNFFIVNIDNIDGIEFTVVTNNIVLVKPISDNA